MRQADHPTVGNIPFYNACTNFPNRYFENGTRIPAAFDSSEHYLTGCAATAMGQLMYYFAMDCPHVRWEAAVTRRKKPYPVSVWSNTHNRLERVWVKLLRGNAQGRYEWKGMPRDPYGALGAASAEEVRRSARRVGALLHDAGVTIASTYYPWGTSGLQQDVADALQQDFGFQQAIFAYARDDNNTLTGEVIKGRLERGTLERMVLPNLILRHPVIASINGKTEKNEYVSHAILIDGYGYEGEGADEILYLHFNMGFNGADGWSPGLIYEGNFSFLSAGDGMDPNFFAPYRLHEITYNIFPNCEPYSGSGKLEIVAGRVLDSAEKPLEARVTARWSGGSRSTVSDARGMYALWVPSNTTVTLRAECGGLGFNELSVDVRASVHESGNKDGTCLVGNVCSADFTARPRKVVYLPGWEDTVEKIFTDRGISVERVGLTALRDSYVLDPAEVDVFIASIPIMSTHYFSIYKKVRDYVEAGGMLIATGPGHAFVTHLGGGFRMQPSHLQGMDLSLPSRLPQHGGVGLREHVEREGAVDNFLFAAKNWPFIESVSDGKSLVIGNMVYENVNTGLPAALNNWPQGMYFKRGKGRAIYTTFPLYRNYTQGSSAVRRAAEYIALLPFNEAGLRRLESSFGLDDGRERSFAFNSPARAGRSGGMRIESVQPGSGLSFLVSLMGGLSGGRGSLRRGGERFSATLIRPDGSEFASQSSGGSRLVFEVPASENTAVASWSVRLDSPGRFTKTGTVAAVCFSGSADIPLDEPAPVIPPAVEDLSDGGGGGSPSGPDRPDDDPPEKSPDVPLPVDPVVPVDPVDPVDPPDPEDPEWGGSGGCGMGGGVVLLWALFPGCLLYAAGKKRL